MILAAIWVVFNVLDLVFTTIALEMGAVEGNPVLNFFLGHSFAAFIGFKLAVAGMVLSIYYLFFRISSIRYTFASGTILIGGVVFYEVLNLI